MRRYWTRLTGAMRLPSGRSAPGSKRPNTGLSRFQARRRDLTAGQEGVSAVEFAFVLPILLILFTGMIDVGVLMLTQSDMVRVAQDAARGLSLGQMTEEETKTYIKDKLGNLGDSLEMAANLPDTDAGETDVTVSISIPMADVIPIDIVGMKNLDVFKKGSLQTQITMRQEIAP